MEGLENWLNYYSQLRQYKESLEQKFISLLFQQGIVAFSAATVIVTVREKVSQNPLAILFIGLVGTIGQIFYCLLTTKYFLHVRKVSEVMVKVEEKLGLSEEMGIKCALSIDKEASIFTAGSQLSLRWIKAYGLVSISVVLVISIISIIVCL